MFCLWLGNSKLSITISNQSSSASSASSIKLKAWSLNRPELYRQWWKAVCSGRCCLAALVSPTPKHPIHDLWFAKFISVSTTIVPCLRHSFFFNQNRGKLIFQSSHPLLHVQPNVIKILSRRYWFLSGKSYYWLMYNYLMYKLQININVTVSYCKWTKSVTPLSNDKKEKKHYSGDLTFFDISKCRYICSISILYRSIDTVLDIQCSIFFHLCSIIFIIFYIAFVKIPLMHTWNLERIRNRNKHPSIYLKGERVEVYWPEL